MSICGEIENTQLTILIYKEKLRKYLKQEDKRSNDLHIYHMCRGLVREMKRKSMLEEISIDITYDIVESYDESEDKGVSESWIDNHLTFVDEVEKKGT